MSQPAILCPSWNCEEGATLLGIVLGDGRVAFAKDRIVIDAGFVKAAQEGRSPEKRFRFSSTCKKSGCVQWTGDRCGVIDRVLDRDPVEITGELPHCTIRANCRWHLQSGDEACYACPGVMTDERPEYVETLAGASV